MGGSNSGIRGTTIWCALTAGPITVCGGTVSGKTRIYLTAREGQQPGSTVRSNNTGNSYVYILDAMGRYAPHVPACLGPPCSWPAGCHARPLLYLWPPGQGALHAKCGPLPQAPDARGCYAPHVAACLVPVCFRTGGFRALSVPLVYWSRGATRPAGSLASGLRSGMTLAREEPRAIFCFWSCTPHRSPCPNFSFELLFHVWLPNVAFKTSRPCFSFSSEPTFHV